MPPKYLVRDDRTGHITMTPEMLTAEMELKKAYLRKAIGEYEYSCAPEYEKSRMTDRAMSQGTVDFEYCDAGSHVELDAAGGAWVKARVWIPSKWMESNVTPESDTFVEDFAKG